jgi:hypothetical protein
MAVPTLDDVKARLNDPAAVDAEVQAMLDAALTRYRRMVGPLDAETVTAEEHTGREVWLERYPVLAVTSVTDSAGRAVAGYAVTLSSGRLTLPTSMTVTVAYTAGYAVVPADIGEAITLDVAGLYSSTQRGGGGRRFGQVPDLEPQPGFPVTLFPRIDAMIPRLTVG